MQVTRPLSADDKKILAGKSQPKEEDVRRAEESLMSYLAIAVIELQQQAGILPKEEDKNVRGLSV